MQNSIARAHTHTDLKGSNVLLTENFDAAITDFGLTLMKHHARGISQHKGEGTCNYMAPELFIVNGPLITGAVARHNEQRAE